MGSSDRGARLGWTLGGIGSLLWLAGMGTALFWHGDAPGATIILACFLFGLLYLRQAAPWRHPQTQLRLLYAGFLAIQVLSAGFVILRYLPLCPELRKESNAWLFFCLLPLFLPLATLGNRTWYVQSTETTDPPDGGPDHE